MLKAVEARQQRLEMVVLEEWVPKDHLLGKLDRYLDFEFIRAHVQDLYCQNNGRPALDPAVLFKMLFIGYLFGIRSEWQLVREVQVNVAYRWFLGLDLTDKVIDASSFSQNRRRFLDSDIEQRIFDAIVQQAMGHGLIRGEVLYTDSTHLKASANKNKWEAQTVTQTPLAYLDALERAVSEDRHAHDKRPLKPSKPGLARREIKTSPTDPESGYMTCEGKPQGFFYLAHRTVDGQHALITDTFVTPGNVHDSRPYLDRLHRQCATFDFVPRAVGLDAGYQTPAICLGLEQRQIYGVIGYRRPNHKNGTLYKRQFSYEASTDSYLCPNEQRIRYRTTTHEGYRQYHSDPAQCQARAWLRACTQSRNTTKAITRHVWQDSVERIDQHRLTASGKRLYRRCKETVERSFADAKQLHGHRAARFRSLRKVSGQCLLAAACQNMKKIALILARFLLFLRALSALYTHQGLSTPRYA